MEATDLYELGVQLVEKIGVELLVPYLGGAANVEKVKVMLIKLTDSLLSSYSIIQFGKHQKIDKDWESSVKEIFYQLETLVHEIEVFLEEGEHSNSILESFRTIRSSVAVKMELILDELAFLPLPRITYASEKMAGREFTNQKDKLINMLLGDGSPIVAILGKPGSGKSTLARLIMDDHRVTEHFTNRDFISLTYTSCQDVVLAAIKCGGRGMSRSSDWPVQVHILLNQLSRAGPGRKCLTVLDDLSDEEILSSLWSPKIITVLSPFSKIIVTSNLELSNASEISMPMLNDDESRDLFSDTLPPITSLPIMEYHVVFDRIRKNCENIPSVIKTVASILSTKYTVEEWEHFIEVVLTSVPNATATISSIFALTELHSHHQIQKNWRHCFAWCSLLPNDYEFGKNCIYHLWRAQDVFIGHQRMTEEELDRCFNEFVRRGYFLEHHRTYSVVTYKISYLVSELMKYVAGDDFCLWDKPTTQPNHKIIRHASFIVDSSWDPPAWLPKAKHLQSVLLCPRSSGEFIFSSKLDFNSWHMTTLHNDVVLSESSPILEYLRIHEITNLSLPGDISFFKRMLDFRPKKSSIEKLAMYYGEEKQFALFVKFTSFRKLRIQSETSNEPCSLTKVNKATLSLKYREVTSLKPHQTLESIKVRRWDGEKHPAWVKDEFSAVLKRLTSVQIDNCSGCKYLPGFDTLPLLSSLIFWSIPSLAEIAVTGESTEAVDASSSSSRVFYPSLKYLALCDLPELKGWSSKEADNNQHQLQDYIFPHLTEIRLQGCPKLNTMPSVPLLESLEAINVSAEILNFLLNSTLIDPSQSDNNQELTETSNQHLSVVNNLEIDGCEKFDWGDKLNTATAKGIWDTFRCLRSLKLSNAPELSSIPEGLQCVTTLEQLSLCWLTNLIVLPQWIGQFTQLRQLALHYCLKLRMLPNFTDSFSALEQLEIWYCPRLCQFPDSFPNLKRLRVLEFSRLEKILRMTRNLEELEIENCEELDLEMHAAEGDGPVTVWEGLTNLESLKLTKMYRFPKDLDLNFDKLTQLHRLVIQNCPEFDTLPESLGSLSSLEHFQIQGCPGLQELPMSFPNLKSLTQLEILDSPLLVNKFQQPSAADWALIQHIPTVVCKSLGQL